MNTIISVDELKALIQNNKPSLRVFDVRHSLQDHNEGEQAFFNGHIPGANYVYVETQLSTAHTGKNGRHPMPSLADVKALAQSLGIDSSSDVVIYDAQQNMFASRLWWMLQWAGFKNVRVLNGGWQYWLAQGGAVEIGEAKAYPASTEAPNSLAKSMPSLTVDQVMQNLTDANYVVVDARAANRYRGEFEPMDPVAGHIPGALNRPNVLNVTQDGLFKTAEQLHQEFSLLLNDAGVSADRIVHQCGSGITACHNLLAMEIAGLGGSSLYPGSWSEWCSDDSRPVATDV